MDIDYKKYHRDSDYWKFGLMFRNIFMKRFNLISRFTKKGRVLEIGSSTGVFLQIFKERGWEVLGIEPSGSANIAGKKGIKVVNSIFENAKLPKEYFDLVILNHTLEHMDNPLAVLKKANSVLKKEGILFVDVPNFGSLLSKIMGKKWPYLLPEEHKWQFTKESLSKLFKVSGFEILHWESRSGIFEYANPFLELSRKRFLLEILTFPYSLLATLLNMGDSMSMIGKKYKI